MLRKYLKIAWRVQYAVTTYWDDTYTFRREDWALKAIEKIM